MAKNSYSVTIDDTNIIDDQAVDSMMDEICSQAEQEMETEVFDSELQKIKDAARKFNEEYRRVATELQNLIVNYSHMEQLRNTIQTSSDKTSAIESYNLKIKEIIGQLIEQGLSKNTEVGGLSQQLYSAVFTFQQALNEFLDQQMELVLVYYSSETKENEIYIINEADYSKYLKYEIHKGNISARFQNFNTMISELNSTRWTDPIFLEEQGYDLNAVSHVSYGEKSALRRYDISREVIENDMQKKSNNNSNSKFRGGLVLWQRPRWKGVWVWNKGDINEAYASILLDRQATAKYTSGNINDILDAFMEAVLHVDAASGALQGDYEQEQTGIEYAVKSLQASALGYEQFHQLADLVLDTDFDRSKLEQWKEKHKREPKNRNIAINTVNKTVGRSLADKIKAAY